MKTIIFCIINKYFINVIYCELESTNKISSCGNKMTYKNKRRHTNSLYLLLIMIIIVIIIIVIIIIIIIIIVRS